jgi:hypothetical protein
MCSPSDRSIGHEYKILRKPQLYATRDIWNMLTFIYFIKDEVMDKAPKQPTTPIKHTQSKHTKHQTQRKLTTFILLLKVAPSVASAGSGGGVTVHDRLLVRALDYGGGRPGVHVRCVEVTGLNLYHPLVPSDGGVSVLQPSVERLDHSLGSQ